MMTIRELIEQLEAAASHVGDDAHVQLAVHDGPVDRTVDPHGWWYTLPPDHLHPHGKTVQIVAEA